MPSVMKILLVCLALPVVAGCAQNPVSGRQDFVMMSEAQEVSEGRRADADVLKQYRAYESPALQNYVDGVGQELARKSHRANLQYRFTVLDTPEVNAFALPGGYVYITRGILAYLSSEAELAAVLGHEIGHVTARHGVRQQSAAQVADIGLAVASIFVPQLNSNSGRNLANVLGGALLSGYGREHELEADRLGAEYLARTEYDPRAMIRVVGVLKNQELFDAEIAKQEGREPRRYHGLFATHPDNDTRLQQVVGESGHLAVANPKEEYTKFLQQIDGMTFSESADQGVVRDNKFLHAGLGVALSFPQGWRVLNLPDKLVAVNPQAEAAMQFTMEEQPPVTPAAFARRMDGNSGSQIEAPDIGGLPAAIATLPAALAGVIYLDQKAYIIRGKAKSPAAFAASRDQMKDAIRSFHALTAAERKLAKPLVIRLVTARPGDTYAKLARHSPLGKAAENHLRLINGNYPDGEPSPGQYVKIVE
ncbi:MAG: M48 family metalloprotease [Nitrosomonadales bacterium]|nr:M48 family metalloprotease [Nitrosomonadales bacterium]